MRESRLTINLTCSRPQAKDFAAKAKCSNNCTGYSGSQTKIFKSHQLRSLQRKQKRKLLRIQNEFLHLVEAIVHLVKLCDRKWVRQGIKDLANLIKTLSSSTKRWAPPRLLSRRKRRSRFYNKLKLRNYPRKPKVMCRRRIGVKAIS